MSRPIIQIENIGKAYRLGRADVRHAMFRDALMDTLKAPFRRLKALGRPNVSEDLFWALRDVSFDVAQGEVVGIIGRNGAGKSTLLKILSRITEPTEGRVTLRGRVASLLEVGTGFHPELTGRENIFLNGSILGMRKVEIEKKFDEIVAFSEIEKFLDTPVKRYSSGMYVRLAFSVAAHLEPEILIVDEVLAVGDMQFQRKCLGKMHEVAHGAGRTVLFVSHNMGAVQQRCSRGVYLRSGQLAGSGKAEDVIRDYLSTLHTGAKTAFADNPDRSGSGSVQLVSVRIVDCGGKPIEEIIAGHPIGIEYIYHVNSERTPRRISLTMTFYNQFGTAVTNFSTNSDDIVINGADSRGQITCRIPELPFPPGEYRVAVALFHDDQIADHLPNAVVFTVAGTVFNGSSRSPALEWCTCMVRHTWEHSANSGNKALTAGIAP